MLISIVVWTYIPSLWPFGCIFTSNLRRMNFYFKFSFKSFANWCTSSEPTWLLIFKARNPLREVYSTNPHLCIVFHLWRHTTQNLPNFFTLEDHVAKVDLHGLFAKLIHFAPYLDSFLTSIDIVMHSKEKSNYMMTNSLQIPSHILTICRLFNYSSLEIEAHDETQKKKLSLIINYYHFQLLIIFTFLLIHKSQRIALIP